MKATRFISSRIFSLSKENLSSIVMKIAIVSIALGISIMLISIAVVVGFKNQIKDKVVGFVSPIQIQVLNQNESMEETPFIYDSVLKSKLDVPFIKSVNATANKAGIIKTDEEIHGVVLKGVDADYDWTYIKSNLVTGEVPVYEENERSNDVVLSKIIADKMLLSVGDDVRLWFVGEDMKTRGRKFLVKGIYETGLTECDERFIYCDLNQIRRLNGWDDDYVGHLEIQLVEGSDIYSVNDYIYYSIPTNLVSYTARNLYPQIFDWLDLQDMNVVIIIVLMLFVSGFSIITGLIILILDSVSLIGTLKALGANDQFVRRIFIYQAILLIGKGMLWGNLLGVALCALQYFTHVLPLDAASYYVSYVPIAFPWVWWCVLNIGTLLVSWLILLAPSAIVTQISPAKVMHFE